jgi:hypothetical protein
MRLRGALFDRFAPEACAFCEGGSGVVFNSALSAAKVCSFCGGTGLASSKSASLEVLKGNAADGPVGGNRPGSVA